MNQYSPYKLAKKLDKSAGKMHTYCYFLASKYKIIKTVLIPQNINKFAGFSQRKAEPFGAAGWHLIGREKLCL